MKVFLDSHMVAKPSSRMVQQMMPFVSRHWQELSLAREGKEPVLSLQKAHERVELLLGASDVTLCSDPLMHLHSALFADYIKPSGKNQVIAERLGYLPGYGCVCKPFPQDVSVDSLEKLITPRTSLISLSWADPISGVVRPMWDIAKLCRERDILLHVDVSHCIGTLFFQFDSIDIDCITFDAAPFHGPKGIGGIASKRPLTLHVGEQDIGARVGVGAAAEEAAESLDHTCLELSRLRTLLETAGSSPFADQKRLPNIATLAFPGIHPELMAFALAERGVFARRTKTYLSFALHRETTEEEIRFVIGCIEEAKEAYALAIE